MPSSDATTAFPEIWANALGMKFRLVKPGSFMMGSPKSESRRFADEEQRRTTIATPYYLSVYQTTQAEWRAATGENPSKRSTSKTAPVESVSWFDCADFLEKINSEAYLLELQKYLGVNWRYAFPTEAQWEYACRAGTTTAYYFGDAPDERAANFGKGNLENAKQSKEATTLDVGSFPPNPWGFYDMCGNVCEWCFDFYADYDFNDSVDPKGGRANAERVARGGSWRSVPENCRSASRFNFLPTFRGDVCGLRVAIVPVASLS